VALVVAGRKHSIASSRQRDVHRGYFTLSAASLEARRPARADNRHACCRSAPAAHHSRTESDRTPSHSRPTGDTHIYRAPAGLRSGRSRVDENVVARRRFRRRTVILRRLDYFVAMPRFPPYVIGVIRVVVRNATDPDGCVERRPGGAQTPRSAVRLPRARPARRVPDATPVIEALAIAVDDDVLAGTSRNRSARRIGVIVVVAVVECPTPAVRSASAVAAVSANAIARAPRCLEIRRSAIVSLTPTRREARRAVAAAQSKHAPDARGRLDATARLSGSLCRTMPFAGHDSGIVRSWRSRLRLRAATAEAERHGAVGHFDDRYNHNHSYPARGSCARGARRSTSSSTRSRALLFGVASGTAARAALRGSRTPIGVFVPLLPPFYTTVWIGGPFLLLRE